MANETKSRRNPYLIVLLKYMLAYEVMGIQGKPSASQIENFFKSKNDYSRAVNKASKKSKINIRKELFHPKDFDFSDSKLDSFVGLISQLGIYSNWEAFSNKFGEDKFAKVAEVYYMSSGYSELPEEVVERINLYATEKVAQLSKQSIVFGKSRNERGIKIYDETIIDETNKYVLRTGNLSEIQQTLFADLVFEKEKFTKNASDPIQKEIYFSMRSQFVRFGNIHKKHHNVFFVHADEYGVWGGIGILPIKAETYWNLQTGVLKFDSLNEDHVVSSEEPLQHLYIYSLHGRAAQSINIILFSLKKILSFFKLSDDAIICAVAKSEKGRKYLGDFGFSKAGVAKLEKRKFDKRQLNFDFFEIESKSFFKEPEPDYLIMRESDILDII